MKLFRSKYERELDSIIDEMKICLANNYKDAAHSARIKLGERCREMYESGGISEKIYKKYNAVYEEYTVMLRDYHH